MWRQPIRIALGVALLAFIAWVLHKPRLDLNDAEETRECARRVLADNPEPLDLQKLNAIGNGSYTGEAIANDGRTFQIQVSPESDGARIDATWRDGRDEQSRYSRLGLLSLARHPRVDQVSTVLLFGLLVFGSICVKNRADPNKETVQSE